MDCQGLRGVLEVATEGKEPVRSKGRNVDLETNYSIVDPLPANDRRVSQTVGLHDSKLDKRRRTKVMNCILGIDPGFASIGLAVVALEDNQVTPIAMTVVCTAKSTRASKVRASSDNHRRGLEIVRSIRPLIDLHKPILICAEGFSFPRQARASALLGRCWGIIDCLAEQYSIPVIEASPQEIKFAVTGSKKASKEEVQHGLESLFPASETIKEFKRIEPRSLYEHGFDALGACVACLESTEVRLLRRLG
jgi:crossover junction endodeoxyribonuclease RuvC